MANFNTITLPSGYKEALKAYEDYFSDPNYNQAKSKELSDDVLKYRDLAMSQNKFKNNKSDDKIVDISNLDSETRAELSQFVALLVNQVRSQVGTNSIISSPEATEFAEQVAQNYNKDNWNSADNGQHDQTALNTSSSQLGINWDGENMGLDQTIFTTDYTVLRDGTELPTSTKQTVNNLKHLIYDDIVSMMFDDADSAWGHSTNFAGIGSFVPSKQGIGFSMDKYFNTHYDLVDANEKVEKDAYTLPSINDLVQKLSVAKDNLSVKKNNQASSKRLMMALKLI